MNLYLILQMLSLLPAKIIKLLEWVGFSGDKVILSSGSVAVKVIYTVS